MWSIAALKLPRKEVFEFTCVPLQNFLCKFPDRGLMWATKLCEKNIFITMDTLLLQNSYYIMYIWPAYLIFNWNLKKKSKLQAKLYNEISQTPLQQICWHQCEVLLRLEPRMTVFFTSRLRKYHSWCKNRRPRSSAEHVYTRAQNLSMSIRCFSFTSDKWS